MTQPRHTAESTLFSKTKIYLDVPLIIVLGFAKAVILEKVAFYNDLAKDAPLHKYDDHFFKGRWWSYDTYNNWHKKFQEALPARSLERQFRELELIGLMKAQPKYNNKAQYDSKWYSVDHEALDAFLYLWEQCGFPRYSAAGTDAEYKQFMANWQGLRLLQHIWELHQEAPLISPQIVPEQPPTHHAETPTHDAETPYASCVNKTVESCMESSVQEILRPDSQANGTPAAPKAETTHDKAVLRYGTPQRSSSDQENRSRYDSIEWRALEDVLITACRATADGLTDAQRRLLSKENPYSDGKGIKTVEPLNDLFDRSEDFKRFVVERIQAQKIIHGMKNIPRSKLVKDLTNITRGGNGWIAWKRINGTEGPAPVEQSVGTVIKDRANILEDDDFDND